MKSLWQIPYNPTFAKMHEGRAIGHWQPGKFKVCTGSGPKLVIGWLWNGCAMRCIGHDYVRRVPVWTLTHIGAGTRLALIHAQGEAAFGIADQFVNLGDWSYTGLHGYKNTDPDLMERFDRLYDELQQRGLVSKPGQSAVDDEVQQVIYANLEVAS